MQVGFVQFAERRLVTTSHQPNDGRLSLSAKLLPDRFTDFHDRGHIRLALDFEDLGTVCDALLSHLE